MRTEQRHRLPDSLVRAPQRPVPGVEPRPLRLVVPGREPTLRGIDDVRPSPWVDEPAPVKATVARRGQARVVPSSADGDATGVPVGDVTAVIGVHEVEACDAATYGGAKTGQAGRAVDLDDRAACLELLSPEGTDLAVREARLQIEVDHDAGLTCRAGPVVCAVERRRALRVARCRGRPDSAAARRFH